MNDIYVNYKVSLDISGDFDQNDIDDIDKIANRIGSIFHHQVDIKTINTFTRLYEVKQVWQFPGDGGWLSKMNPVKLFDGFNFDGCKYYLKGIGVNVSDSFINKILSKKITIKETISF